jgi:hypothetical protein
MTTNSKIKALEHLDDKISKTAKTLEELLSHNSEILNEKILRIEHIFSSSLKNTQNDT